MPIARRQLLGLIGPALALAYVSMLFLSLAVSASVAGPRSDGAEVVAPGYVDPKAAPVPPLGLDIDGREYALLSNNQWDVSSNGGPFVDARHVVRIRPPRPGGTSAYDRQPHAYIWAPQCTAALQTVVFRRALFMPGPPKTLAMQFSDTTGTSPPADTAIGGVRIFINGTHTLSFKGASYTLPTGQYSTNRLFRHGLNIIEIRVTKRKQSGTSIGRCQYGNPPKPLGLQFAIYGEFEVDLWLSNDNGITHEQYVKQEGGVTVVDQFGFDWFRNLGPSGAYRGTVTLHISGSTLKAFKVVSVEKQGPEIEDCKITVVSPYQSRVDCQIDRMPPRGPPRAVIANVRLTFYPTYSTAFVFVAMEAYSPTRDVNGRSNGYRYLLTYCGPDASHTKCPK